MSRIPASSSTARTPQEIAALRGKTVAEVLGIEGRASEPVAAGVAAETGAEEDAS
jgi:hypothetical protein